MSGLEVFICVALVAFLIWFAGAADNLKFLHPTRCYKFKYMKSEFVTIEKKTVSYYGLCGIKVERIEFLIAERGKIRDSNCYVGFDIPDGYSIVAGSQKFIVERDKIKSNQ